MIQKKTTSRRQFVRRAVALAAGGAAAPGILRSDVLAAPRTPAANDRVGIGYIGVGRRAQQLMNLPQGAQIVAVADVNRDRAARVAAAKKCRAYYDYRALLDSPDVDAVIVATPDHWHALPNDSGEVLRLADGPAGGATFVGERGKISVDRGRFTIDPPELAEELEQQPSGGGDATVLHLQNWIDCIKTRERCVADIEIGHRSATVCHLGNIARWMRCPLRWDPAREVFVDDAEANALLDRERREPYELPNPV